MAALTVSQPAGAANQSQTQIASDTFGRTTTSGWGSAEQGGSYALGGQKSAFSVAGNAGHINSLQPGKSGEAYLPGVSSADTLVQSVMTVPTTNPAALNFHYTVEARRQSNGSTYRGRAHLGAGGAVSVAVSRTDGKSETALASANLPLNVTAGQNLEVQLQVTGTNPVIVSVRAWIVNTSIPSWQVSASDSSASRISSAGSVGLWAYVSGSAPATSLTTNNFAAYNLGSVASPALLAPAAVVPATTYKSANFDNMPLGAVVPQNFVNALGATNKNASAYDDMSIVNDTRGSGNAVRTNLKANTIHSIPATDNGDNLFIPLPGSYDTACLQYDIRFDPNFDWSLGGKLPGLEGVAPGYAPSTPTGGDNTDLGWSGRMMWLGPKAYSWAGPTNMAVSYMYHPGQADSYGDNVRWNKAFVAGTWHTVKQCYVMNTVGQANGQLKAWMDGAQVVNNTSFVYRTRADVHINYLDFSLFRGGNTISWAGSHDDYVDIDNMSVTSS